MLSTPQSLQLKKLLQRPKSTLQQCQQDFASTFKQPLTILSAISHLFQLHQSQSLQIQQQIISLYLILVSYHESSPECHPFIMNILWISETTKLGIERTMIYEVLIRRNKTRYCLWVVEDICGIVEKDREKDIPDQDKEIKNLRNKLQEKYRSIQYNLPVGACHDQVPEFLRLVPQYIDISTSQLNWLSPGIISDVEWDNSAEIDKKLQKSRKIFQNALKRTLQQQQRTQLISSIQTDPYSPLHIGFSAKDLNQLIIHNSYIAASLVIKLSKYPIFQQYLQQFLALPTSASLLDVTARIIKQIRVPQLYVEMFCTHHMNKMIKTRENGENYKGLAYTMTAFLHCMFENQIVNPYRISAELKNFMSQFNNILDFGHIKILLEQQHQNLVQAHTHTHNQQGTRQ